jgi:hypothetical protein
VVVSRCKKAAKKKKGEDMKFAKYLVTLAFALFAITSATMAQNGTVMFLGGGSSALFNEMGQASQKISDSNGAVSCLWSYAKTTSPSGTPYIAANDGRSGINLDENGTIWIAWGAGSGTCSAPVAPFSIYAYISLDSVVGDRCYFATDASGTPGCTLKLQNTTGVAGTSQVLGVTDTTGVAQLPTTVVTPLAGAHFFVAGTDIRPEDAQFVIQRAFTPCNQYMPRQYFNNASYYIFGLGYEQNGNANLGLAIQGNSNYGAGSFNVVNFNITGTDPISGNSVPSFTVSTVGAQPLIVAASPTTDGNVATFSDINGFTLTLFLQGVLGRTSDFYGAPSDTSTNPAAEAVTTILREPLSGTYNTMEFSIPDGTQYHASQEYSNCNSSGTVLQQALGLSSANGNVGQRVRAIGTGNVTKYLRLATTPTLGYFFWSAGNVGAGSATPLANVKYLKVNGIDPLLNQDATGYTYNGVLPGTGATGDPGLGAVTFSQLYRGNYPIWSALRIVTPTTGNGVNGVAAMLTALHTLDSTQNDYIPVNSMTAWHSHFVLNGNPTLITNGAANGATVGGGTTTLCAGGNAEAGGDAGGTSVLVINNVHFCKDYGNPQGLLNKTQ